MYSYDHSFYQYINKGAIASAEVIVPQVLRLLNVTSVADFGCGQGAWLTVWKNHGVSDVVGIDGDYVSRESLLIGQKEFVERDLKGTVRLNRTFDLVQSLEVAEHLPPNRAKQFVKNLVTHADIVMFSAAVPGQGGENHVNEQPYEYWRGLFKEHDYLALDCIRPSICRSDSVEPWYRYNTLVYVRREALGGLDLESEGHLVPETDPIPDFSPLLYRLRKGLIRILPHTCVTWLAIVNRILSNATSSRTHPR